MKFISGDKIKLLNENAEGIFIEYFNTTRVIVLIDGFEYTHNVKDIIKTEKNTALNKVAISPQIKSKKQSEVNNFNTRISKKSTTSNEVDLHIYNLTSNYKGLSNGEILEIQIDYFRKKLDQAMLNKQRAITFIHGVGHGVLKDEIRHILQTYSLTHYDASYRKFGFGATEVIL